MQAPTAPGNAPAGLPGAVLEPTPGDVPAIETSGWNAGSVIAVIVATALLVAGVTLFLNRVPTVELPEGFGGLPQASGPEIDEVHDEFHRQVEGLGIHGNMGLYGTDAFPTVALVWVEDPSVDTTDAAWNAFAAGFNQGLPAGSVDETGRTSEVVDGVTYLCAQVDAASPSNVCLWEEGQVFWILVDLSGASQGGTQDLAVTAHDAIAA
jgi:hypothetical protein